MKTFFSVILACGLLTQLATASDSHTTPPTSGQTEQKKLTPTQAVKLLEAQNFFGPGAYIMENEAVYAEVLARFRQMIHRWEQNPDEVKDYPWVSELLHLADLSNAHFLIRPDILQCFIDHTANINAKDAYGRTATDYALLNVTQFFEPLRAAGATFDVAQCTPSGMTAVFCAVQEGNKSLVEYFIEKGAYVNDINNYGESLLAVALQYGHEDIAELLIKSGARPDLIPEDDEGYTLLHHAAMGGCTKLLKQLIKAGADIHTPSNEHRQTPLMLAFQYEHADTAAELLKLGAKLHQKDKEKFDATHYAFKSGNGECIAVLIQEEKKKKTLSRNASVYLDQALNQGLGDVACLLLQSGATFDAEQDGWNYLGAALRCRNPKLLHLLEEAGARYDSQTPDDEGVTHLMLAAEAGYPELVKQFINDEADIHATDNNNINVLTYALSGGEEEVILLLREAGAKPDIAIVTQNGETQLMLAARNGLLAEVRELLQLGAPVDTLSDYNKTALMEALEQGHENVAEELIKAGAKLSIKHGPGKRTQLMCAAQGGLHTFVKKLLQMGSNPNDVMHPSEDAYTPDGTTALMLAAQNGHDSVVRLLLDSGALPHLRNEDGQTAADLARENGHTALADFLQSLP